MKDEIDIGYDIRIRWDDDGEGFIWKHPECRAWSRLRLAPDPASTGHARLSGGRDDMANFSIKGSLLCPMGCGKHGFITNGKWVVG